MENRRRSSWSGFEGRVFLSFHEWQTYRKRPPVRYAASSLSERLKVCEICGATNTPLQAAHRIPFLLGVQRYGFTPDWLDRAENLAWSCARNCNNKVEWSHERILAFLDENCLSLPDYVER